MKNTYSILIGAAVIFCLGSGVSNAMRRQMTPEEVQKEVRSWQGPAPLWSEKSTKDKIQQLSDGLKQLGFEKWAEVTSNLDAVDSKGDTPLLFIARNLWYSRSEPYLRLLKEAGANVNYINPKDGKNALSLALSADTKRGEADENMADILRELGVKEVSIAKPMQPVLKPAIKAKAEAAPKGVSWAPTGPAPAGIQAKSEAAATRVSRPLPPLPTPAPAPKIIETKEEPKRIRFPRPAPSQPIAAPAPKMAAPKEEAKPTTIVLKGWKVPAGTTKEEVRAMVRSWQGSAPSWEEMSIKDKLGLLSEGLKNFGFEKWSEVVDNPNTVDSKGDTALLFMARNLRSGRTERFLELLKQAGANMRYVNPKDGKNAVALALSKETKRAEADESMAETLRELGA